MTEPLTLFTVQAMTDHSLRVRSDALMSLLIRRQQIHCTHPDPEYAAEMDKMLKDITEYHILALWEDSYLCDYRR